MKKKSLLLLIPFAAAALSGCTPILKPCEQASITFKATSLVLIVGDTKQIEYTIPSPGNRCIGTLTFESDDESIATVDSSGKVTGVSEGTAVITCNGVEITIFVEAEEPDPEHEVVSVIGVKSHPSTVKVGEKVNPNNVILDVEFADGTQGTAKATKVEVDTSEVAQGVTATAYYREVDSAEFTIDVVDDEEDPGYGTIENPLSVSQAVTKIGLDCPEDGNYTQQLIYCLGEVKEIKNQGMYENEDYWFQLVCTDGVSDVVVYRIHATAENKSLIEVGNKILWCGFGKNFKDDLEFVDSGSNKCTLLGDEPAPTKEVVSIEIDGTAKTNYFVGDAYTSQGLSVTAHYDDGTSGKVSANISCDKQKAALGDTSVTFSATYADKSATKVVNVVVTEKPAPVAVNVEYSFDKLTKDDTNALDETAAKTIFEEGLTLGEDIVCAVTPTKSYTYDGSLRVGTSNATSGQGQLLITTSKNITQVVITAHAYRGTEFNNVSIGSQSETVSADPTEFTFMVASTNSITIDTSKRVLIDKIGFVAENITPIDPEVTGIAVSPTSLTLGVGESSKVTANVTTKGTASKDVTWSVVDANPADCVSVDAQGNVSGTAAGTATVVATSTFDTSKSASCAVTVETAPVVELVSIEATNYTDKVDVGQTYTFNGKVMGHYSNGSTSEITSGFEVSAIDTSTAGAKEGTITYQEHTCKFTVNVTEPSTSSLKDAYEAAESASGDTEQFTFTGVVSGLQGNSFIVADGDYAILVYNYQVANIAIGKMITVKATLKNYGGLVETSTVESATLGEDGVVPTPVNVSTITDINNLKTNVLVNAQRLEVVSVESKWTASYTNNWTLKIAGTDVVLSLNKFTFDSAKSTFLKGLKVGDMFNAYNVAIGSYNGVKQLSSLGNSTFEAYVPEITGVSISGDFTKKNYSVGDNWDISGLAFEGTTADGSILLSSDKFDITFNPATAADTAVTQVTVTATYKENVSLVATKTISDITVAEEPDPTKDYTLTYTSTNDPEGLTSNPSAGNFDSTNGRAAQWSNNEGLTLTTSSSYTGVTKIVLTTSTNSSNDAYEVSCTVGGNQFGESISMQKGNNMELVFEDDAASGVVVITYTLKGTKKSVYVKTIVITAQ